MSEEQSAVTEFSGAHQNRLVATVYTPDLESKNPPALFMHGGGQTRHSWDAAAAQLAHLGVTSISVDARGHGDSDWVPDQHYSFHDYRDDMIALVEQVTDQFGRPPILIGASMGGLSGMLTVQKAGSSVFSAMIFVDITPTLEKSGVEKIQGFMAQNMAKGFANTEEAANAIAAYLPDRARPKNLDGLRKNLRRRDDGRLYWHWDPGFLKGPRTIDTDRDLLAPLLLEGCREISVPTLLVRGGKSELVTEHAAQEFLQLVPHARFVDVSEAGHMVAGDKNDIFAKAVIDFLKLDVLTAV